VLVAVAESSVTVEISNLDTTPHTFGVFRDAGGRMPILSPERVEPGNVIERTFTSPPPGSYILRCELHPGRMIGSFVPSKNLIHNSSPPVGARRELSFE
jgi:hypothetical protein